MNDAVATPQAKPAPMQRFSRADILFAVAIVVLIVFAAVASDSFLTQRNIVNISRGGPGRMAIDVPCRSSHRPGAVPRTFSSTTAPRGTMAWRRADPAQSVTIAVVMALPGLFGEAARQLVFPWATGLQPATQPAFAAAIFFGNGVLLAYAVWRARNARQASPP